MVFRTLIAAWRRFKKVPGEHIEGMSPTVHIPAMLGYSVGNQYMTKQITMIGVDETTYSSVSDFGQYLQHPDNRKHLDFQLQAWRLRHDRPSSDESKQGVATDANAGCWLGVPEAQGAVHVADFGARRVAEG